MKTHYIVAYWFISWVDFLESHWKCVFFMLKDSIVFRFEPQIPVAGFIVSGSIIFTVVRHTKKMENKKLKE